MTFHLTLKLYVFFILILSFTSTSEKISTSTCLLSGYEKYVLLIIYGCSRFYSKMVSWQSKDGERLSFAFSPFGRIFENADKQRLLCWHHDALTPKRLNDINSQTSSIPRYSLLQLCTVYLLAMVVRSLDFTCQQLEKETFISSGIIRAKHLTNTVSDKKTSSLLFFVESVVLKVLNRFVYPANRWSPSTHTKINFKKFHLSSFKHFKLHLIA